MKERSPMSIHYAKYASTGFRVEYVGEKPHNDCIKTIQVEREWGRRRVLLPVDFLLFPPDGTRVLSNSEQGVFMWEATSGKLVANLLAGDNETGALSAAYLPNGRYIIAANRDCTIRKWDVLTSCLVWERVMDEREIDSTQMVSAVFSPDRKFVVFGNNRGTILVWDVETGERNGRPLKEHTESISCLSFSSDGRYLASGSEDTAITIWSMDRREMKSGQLKIHTERVTMVDFSPSRNNIVSCSWDGTICVSDVSKGEVLRKIICVSRVETVACSPNGLLILAGGYKWMNMWNVADDTDTSSAFQVDGSIRGVSFSPDSNRFVSVSDWVIRTKVGSGSPFIEGKIQIWDASRGMERIEASFKEQGVIKSISLSPGCEFIASGADDGSIYLWNVLNSELVKTFKVGNRVNSVVFSPFNERLIAFGSHDGTVRVWDVINDELILIGNHKGPVRSVAFLPSDGKYIASGSEDNTIRIWNTERRELAVGPLTGHTFYVLGVACSPDGKRLASGSADKTIRIWNSETGQLLSTLNGHFDCINSIGYSSDGLRIVSGSDDNMIIVWDAQNGQIVYGPITGHRDWVSSVCFSSDGRQILSGSLDNTARVWDALTGQLLFPPFSGHTRSLNSVCFFPGGNRFATGSKDGTIRIWTLGEIPNDTSWELRDDNWVVDESGKKLVWIPTNLRRYLCGYRNISLLNRSFCLKLHFGTK